MNADLKKFLEFIVNPESRHDIDGYIASRKINDENLTLTVGYLNGAAFIKGIAFDRLIKVRFNYFENSCGFYVNIDGEDIGIIVPNFVLDHFFTNGKTQLEEYYEDEHKRKN